MSVVFILIIGFATFTLFTVKTVEVDLTLYDYSSEQADAVVKTLRSIKGDNIATVSEDKVKNLLSEYTYFEVNSVEKRFPDKIEVSVKERRAEYYCEADGAYYVISDEGFVLEKTNVLPSGKELVKITASSQEGNLYTFGQQSVGGYFCNANAALDGEDDSSSAITAKLFEIAQSVDVLDCVNEIVVFNAYGVSQIDFYTKTSVVLRVFDVFDDGVKKVSDIVDAYNESDDFAKADYRITLGQKGEDGKYTVIWTPFSAKEMN